MTAVVESHVEQTVAPAEPVDREKTCPLLLRVFCSNARHHRINEYFRGSTPHNELQMYTWLDATLRELMGLIKEVNAEARRPGTTFEFALVRPDVQFGGQYEMRELGTTVSGQKGLDDLHSLQSLKFTIGDFIDVAINLPNDVRGRGGFNMAGRGGRSFGGGDMGRRRNMGGGPARFDRDAPPQERRGVGRW